MNVPVITTTCPFCGSPVLPGNQWCTNCHGNLVNPNIGKLAEPGKRLGAAILDAIIPSGIFFFFFLPFVMSVLGFGSHNPLAQLTSGLLSLILAMACIVYLVWCCILFNQGMTPGKLALGLKVVKSDGSSPGFLIMLIREWIGKWISACVFYLGFIWILIDKDRQGWHDKIVNTYVVDSSR